MSRAMPAKSKLGCRTCRRRKIKCDETFPSCRQCSNTGRQCDGPFRNKFVTIDLDATKKPSPPQRHKALQLPRSCSTLPELDARGSRAFEYFLHRVAPALGGELDAQFWRVLLPSISHGDSGVRYAVLAISQLYEMCSVHLSDQAGSSDESQKQFLRWHGRSLSDFRSRMAKLHHQNDHLMGLLSCVLLTNIEFQRNNVLSACNLLRCGNALVESMQYREEHASDRADNPERTIAQMLVRQRIQMAIFGHCDSDERSGPPVSLPDNSKSVLETLTQARHCLSGCLFETMQLVRATTAGDVGRASGESDKLSLRRMSVLRILESWHQNFLNIQKLRQEQCSPAENIAAKILLLHYETALVWTLNSLQPDRGFDAYANHFERIVQLAAEVTSARRNEDLSSAIYSFEMGMIGPLYWTGWKCRQPAIRRRALSLIRQGPTQEALFSADLHARALEKIIEIEEGPILQSVKHETKYEIVPPFAPFRIMKATVHYETWAGEKVKPTLIYNRCIYGDSDGSTLQQGTVPL